MSYKKQIFRLNDLKKFLTEENSCVFLIPTVRLLALPPFFLNDMKSGILYLLNNMLKKYDRSLGGIVIGYQNIKVLMDENTGVIPIGTSETEVNISVEFYIFQPRIGSYLEGVVNKKSNNHIGCLVHRYFNATILKADDIDYEDWVCKDFNVDDKIIFKVKDLDFTSLLPYIEGVINNDTLLDNNKYNMHKSCDTDSLMINSLSKNSQQQILLDKNSLRHEGTSYEKSEDDFFENKNVKNKNAKSNALEGNFSLNKNLEKVDSFINLRKKKKKKDTEEKKLTVSVDCKYSKKEKDFSDTEVTSNTIIYNEADESILSEKKKGKKKLDDINRSSQKSSAAAENITKVNSSDIRNTVLEKLDDLVENEKSCDFLKPFKKRREEKKKNKKENSQISNKSSQCLSSSKMEDSVLYSTLIDPVQSEKMRISFCSPIPQGTPVGRKKGEVEPSESLESRVQLNSQNESDKNEKNKKQKKRKGEEKESEDFPISKKLKTSHSVLFKKEAKKGEIIHDEYKLDIQKMMEQLYNQQLNKIKEEINISDKDNSNEEKKKKKKLNNRRKEIILNEVLDNKNTEVQVNGREDVEKKCDEQNNRIETQIEESNILKQQSFKRKKRTDVKLNKKKENCEENMRENSLDVNIISNEQKNFITKGEKKSEVQNILDGLLKQEMNRMKINLKSCETNRVEKKKEIEAVVSKQEPLREGSHLSLYEKLLKEAKSAIEVDGIKLLNSIPAKQLKKNNNGKESDLSDFSTNSSKKKDLGKKKHNKEKAKICHQTSDKYKNGSMYDTLITPEKVNPDRSLFSDSEQSLTSPVKKKKEACGIESNFGKSIVQNMLDEFCKEERKRLQSESDKESLISLKNQEKKKSKSEQRSQDSNEKKESLYEKLLREARSLIDSKEESPPKKKKNDAR